MLSFNLNEVFKARQIAKPYTFLVKAGFSPHAAAKITSNSARILRLDHIERLCEILHCEPNDLLAYKPNSHNNLSKNHPLFNLVPKEEDLEWQETLKTISLSQLKEISKLITKSKEE
jgi:DNA-binding Xre family transcriptional regulator